MPKFIALYCIPHTGLADWMKIPQEQRQAEEDRLKVKWQEWSKAQGAAVLRTVAAGKNTRVTSSGPSETANDVMMYSIVEAADKDAAVKMFVGHPHLEIPGAWIDVMPANKMEM